MSDYLNERRRRTAAKFKNRWGEGLDGQRLPGYRIAVTETTHRGRIKRGTFVLAEDTWDEPGGPHWERVTKTFKYHDGHSSLLMSHSEPLPPTVQLARGFDLPATILAVILDALVSDSHHQIDLSDVKRIRSQLGRRIVQLKSLPADQRGHAEQALYREILTRCTRI